jgi:tartrate-resistant acid phosphatase type 5
MDSLIYLLMHIGNKSKAQQLSLNNHDDIRFIAIGDWGSGRGRQKDVAKAMGDFCQRYRCDFIITTGDNFYKRGVDSVFDEKFDKIWRNIYTHPSIADLPW